MLRLIKVNGFRSLQSFELDLRKNVNVLVGPNGAGKTNIIAFIELISLLTQDSLSDSLLRMGGVSANFAISASPKLRRPIEFYISGETDFEDIRGKYRSEKTMVYEIEATIFIDPDSGFIFFEKQKLRLKTYDVKGQLADLFDDRPRWDLEISHDATKAGYSNVSILHLNQSNIEVRTIFGGRNSEEYSEPLSRRIVAELEREEPAVRFFPMIAMSCFPVVRHIRRDLFKGKAFNIIPEHVKRREDISTAPGIREDGSGLSATLLLLFRMSKRYNGPKPKRLFSYRSVSENTHLTIDAFDRIISLLSVINPEIVDLEVSVDEELSYIKVILVMVDKSGRRTKVPLQQVSDGTAKWLSFVAITQTNSDLFAIEEPENFLHPHLQRLILEIIRSARLPTRRQSFALITTHSETLINTATPEELVIVSLNDGRTTARRVNNPELVASEINETGFGLSFFYTSESL